MSSMKSLVIAEKPSVANLIADALSIDKKSKKAEFYENENFIIDDSFFSPEGTAKLSAGKKKHAILKKVD